MKYVLKNEEGNENVHTGEVPNRLLFSGRSTPGGAQAQLFQFLAKMLTRGGGGAWVGLEIF